MAPDAMSLALGTTGGMISIERLEDGSYQANGSALTSGTVVTAENGNMYTVMISDDGMFSAEYVVPAALSIPLGSSGSAVDVVKNEDGTFSVNGKVITAETMVTAANGNVYRAILSPEGIPVGVMHVAAMQDVMLGMHGGSVTLTQAEDKSWWYGEAAVADGYVHTAENGNMYALTLDSEGMWSAMYQQVEVTVALGTQGSITLVRAEDMSWWLGTEAVDTASEVNSANGNTYTLWYTDGVWSARFEPESMMIEGTGLVAMTREADDMYDVGDSTLAATGVGDVTDGDAMYHVWMQDGALMGARFDAAIDPDTDHQVTNRLGVPRLSANDPDTPGSQLRTHLVATGDADSGEGMFSMQDLLGSGMASDAGERFVDEAVKAIEKVRADVAALLALDSKPATLEAILEGQWNELEKALDPIFGTTSDADPDTATVTSAVRGDAPRQEDILDDIDDILDALASEASFVAATAEGGGGVFVTAPGEHGVLGSGGAADAFNRLRWSADATLGMTGSTRYGTVTRKKSDNAKSGPISDVYGAFSYSTMQQTVRTSDAAAVSLTGIASYSGGTRAVNMAGKTYSGQMDLQVRFKAESVSGVVSGLEDADGLPWQHNFAEVDRIVLGDARLLRNAQWNRQTSTNDNEMATVFYAANSGLLRPVDGIENTFRGILLGQGAAAGSEANGAWSVGAAGGSGYLTGGFGVQHVGDATRPTPSGDDGSASTAMLFSTVTDTENNNSTPSIADGMLTVKVRNYGWDGRSGDTAPTYQPLTDNNGTPDDDTDDTDILVTAKFDLAALAASGAVTPVNGPKWVDGVIATLQRERALLSTLQSLSSGDTQAAELLAWQRVQDAVQFNIFNGLTPEKLGRAYTALASEAEAIDLIDRALDALSSSAKLEAALDPDGTGVFDHYWIDTDTDGVADDDEIHNFLYRDTVDRRNEVVNNNDPADDAAEITTPGSARNGRTPAQILGQREHQVFAQLGTTEVTRFGFWRRESTVSARRNGAGQVLRTHGGPGTFAYSPLDPTRVGTLNNLGFPAGGSARYTGETVAIQLTTPLSGTVTVDVSWATPTTVAATTALGTMGLTISNLASAVGDPLTQGGSADRTSATAAGNEIGDIVFPGLSIVVGSQGDFAGNLIVGTAGTPDDDSNVAYTEAAVTGARYRQAAAGADLPGAGTATVKALFVGQGVDGPLGVIGTWTLTDGAVGRLAPDGSHTDDLGAAIYGAFGAEAP